MANEPKERRNYFPRVKEAREALKVRAHEIVKLYLANAKEAKKHGEHEVTMKSLQWLMEHMPADDDGGRMIEASIDKSAKADKPSGPQIQIGFALGGMSTPKQLSEGPIIEAEVIEPVRGRKAGHGG